MALTNDFKVKNGLTVTDSISAGGNVSASNGSFTSLSVDTVAINGDTISSTGNVYLDSAGDIILDADGSDILLADGGTTFGKFASDSNNLNIFASQQDKDIVFKGNDGGASITALTLDMSDGGSATFNNFVSICNSSLKLGGTAVTSTATELNLLDGFSSIPGACCQGTTTPSNTQTFTNKSGNISQWTNDCGYITAASNGTVTSVTAGEGMTQTGTSTINPTLNVIGAVGGGICVTTDAVCVDSTVVRTSGAQTIAGTKNFCENICVGGNIYHTGDSDTRILLETNTITLLAGNEQHLKVCTTGVVINDGGLNNDFRVEGDNDPNLLFVDGSADKVGIGTSSPLAKLHIDESTNDVDAIKITNTPGGSGSVQGKVHIGMSHFGGTNPSIRITAEENGTAEYRGNLLFSTRSTNSDVVPTEKMRITHDGKVGIGTTSPVTKLDVSTTGADGINLSKDTGATNISTRLFFSNATAGQGVSIYNSSANMMFQTGSTAGSTTGNTRMVINSAGRVGIGTTSPSSLLHLEAAASPTLQIKDTSNNVTLKAFSQDSNAHLGTFSNHPLAFDTNSSERMRITSAGFVGIGTTSPASLLHIAENDNGGNAEIILENSFTNTGSSTDETTQIQGRFGGFDGSWIITGKEGDYTTAALRKSFLSFSTRTATTGMGEKMRITSTGNVGIGTTSPGGILDVDGQYGDLKIGDPSVGSRISYYDTTRILLNSNELRFYTNSLTERMRIDSSGNVGIGTTSPNAKLDIVSTGAGSEGLRVDGANGGFAFVVKAGSDYTSHIRAGATIGASYFTTPPSNGLIVQGNVGIGCSSPTQKLAVAGDGLFTSDLTVQGDLTVTGDFTCLETTVSLTSAMDITNTGTGPALVVNQTGSNDIVNFQDDGTSAFYIEDGGNVGIGTTDPKANLHVRSSNAGSFTYDTTADDFIVESNGNGGMTIATAAANTGRIIFASPDDATGSEISYNSSGGVMKVGTTNPSDKLILQGGNGVEFLRLDGAADLNIFYKDTFHGDGRCALFGDNSDLKIYHTGTDSIIKDAGTGGIKIDSNYVEIRNAAGTETQAKFIEDGAVNLYYDNITRLCTTAGGVNINGGMYLVNDLTVNGGDITLGGTGRIQGIDTVSSGTDAANKTYVDTCVATKTSCTGTVDTTGTPANNQVAIFTDSNTIEGDVDLTFDGNNLNVGTTTKTSNTNLYVQAGDSCEASICLYGSSQGTGNVYVGQSSTYGGGMLYNGDGNPSRPGGNDNIVFYRRTGGTDSSVMCYAHNTATVCFAGDINICGGDITLGGTGRIQGIDTVSASTDAANKNYVDTCIAAVPTGDITTVTAGPGLCGGGTSGAVTICHCDTSSQGSVNNSNGIVIQDITLDTYGHVTALGSCDLDNRYYKQCDVYTQSCVNTLLSGKLSTSGCAANSALLDSIDSSQFLRSDTSDTASSTINFSGNICVGSNIYHTGDSDTYLQFVGANDFRVVAAGRDNLRVKQTEVVINEASNDVDFRVESNSCSSMLFVDGGNNRVGIGTSSPSATLAVNGSFTATCKSFLVDNPVTGGQLKYGVVEGNEHGVTVRGTTCCGTIDLPAEWDWLVEEDSVTAQITPVGSLHTPYVVSQDNKQVVVCSSGCYNYNIYGTRKDVEPLEVNIL